MNVCDCFDYGDGDYDADADECYEITLNEDVRRWFHYKVFEGFWVS